MSKVINFNQYREERIMARDNTARNMYDKYCNSSDTINVMTFEEWEDVRESMSNRQLRKKRRERKRMAMYFKRQRAFGFSIMLFGIIVAIVGHFSNIVGLQYLGVGVGLLSLYPIFTKEMMLVDEYFLEYQDKLNQY